MLTAVKPMFNLYIFVLRVGDDDLENLEPDLKAAILKVRKLDRILAKKIKREREVKRDRIILQRKWVLKL